MVNNKEEVKKAFDRFLTQQAREQECHDDEVVDVIHMYIVDSMAEGNLC